MHSCIFSLFQRLWDNMYNFILFVIADVVDYASRLLGQHNAKTFFRHENAFGVILITFGILLYNMAIEILATLLQFKKFLNSSVFLKPPSSMKVMHYFKKKRIYFCMHKKSVSFEVCKNIFYSTFVLITSYHSDCCVFY